MSTVTIQTRIDAELKKQAENFFNSMGLDMTTAIRLFLKQVINQKKIPFDIVASDDFYNLNNLEILKRSIDQLEGNNGTIHDLIED